VRTSFEFDGGGLLDALATTGRRIPERAKDTVDDVAERVRARAARNSPIDKGTYTRAWAVETVGPHERLVYNPRPQARRLELGFVGADSLGRVYDQRGRPHLGPAMENPGIQRLRDGMARILEP
jgi:hypothetical protein